MLRLIGNLIFGMGYNSEVPHTSPFYRLATWTV